MLDECVARDDPWSYLNSVNDIPSHSVRQQHTNAFFAMVARRSPAETDALLTSGQRIFLYRIDTARSIVEQIRSQTSAVTKIAPLVETPDLLAEIVYRPGETVPIKYLIYRCDPLTNAELEPEIADSVRVGMTVYMPPQTVLVEKGTVNLPTGVAEYDTHTLLDEIRGFIASYLYIENPQFLNLIVFYVLLTWVFDRFDAVPYLRSLGDYGTGKTRLLQVAGAVSYRSIMAGGATTASPIFRIIERFKGTLIIDEADFSDSDMWSEVVKILNAGYMRGFPVLRSERGDDKDNFDVKAYDCYGPKILSTRRRFKDLALESRCLTYTMRGGIEVPRTIPLFLNNDFRERATALRNKLLLWRFRHYRTAVADPYRRIEGIEARLNQIAIPLLTCAHGEPGLAREIEEHVLRYQKRMRDERRESIDGKLAEALLQCFKRSRNPQRIMLKEVTEQLNLSLDSGKHVESRTVSSKLRGTFDLDTPHIGGQAWIMFDENIARRLCKQYGLQPEQYGLKSEPPPQAETNGHGDPRVVANEFVTITTSQGTMQAVPTAGGNGSPRRQPVRLSDIEEETDA